MLNKHKEFSTTAKKGFTIVELLIVIVVIAILAAITIVAYNGVSRQAHETSLKSDLRNAASQLGIDQTTNGGYPLTLAAANSGNGITHGENTSYEYTSNGSSYCLTAYSSISGVPPFHFDSATGTILEGACSGHTGSSNTYIASTPAGSSTSGYANGSGSSVRFNFYSAETSSSAGGIDLDSEGNLYIADHGNNLIRKMTSSGTVSTIAGMTGDNGEIITDYGATSSFDYPFDLHVVNDGSEEALIVTTNGCIRIVYIDDVPDYATGILNGGALGPHDGHYECTYNTNAGSIPVWNSWYRDPGTVVADSDLNLYINEISSSTVRKIAWNGSWWGNVSVLSGAGSFGGGGRFGVDPQNNIYNSYSNKVARFTQTGVRTDFVGSTTAGNVDGSSAEARFNNPEGVDLDATGNVYVADCNNHSVRKISPTGDTITIAGDGTNGHQDGEGATAKFYCPIDIAVSADGSVVYVLDVVDHGGNKAGYIRKLTRS